MESPDVCRPRVEGAAVYLVDFNAFFHVVSQKERKARS